VAVIYRFLVVFGSGRARAAPGMNPGPLCACQEMASMAF
jgi:hypothetical protein